MKNNILSLCILILASCTNQIPYAAATKSMDSLYAEAKDLKGLGQFSIGNTTIKDINAYNKKIGDGYSSLFKTFSINSDEFKGTPLLQRYDLSKFTVNESELGRLRLYFYSDTLYEILLESPEVMVKKAFFQKYGKGVGDSSYYESGSKKNRSFSIEEYYTWQNSSVIANYVQSFHSSGATVTKNTHYLEIKANGGISKRAAEYSTAAYYENKAAKEKEQQKTIDKL